MGLKLNFKLDPRTKIIILVLISFMVFNEVPLYISGILVLIPFICLFFSNRIGIALSYILMYIVAKYIQIYLLPTATGIIAILMIMFSYTTTRMLPVLMMGYYTVTTTKVSEFIVSMEKSNIPKEVTIPLYEEIKSITNAMKMRGFGLNVKSLKNPLKLVEFYMIPILVSAIKTADELSAASLTRGLSNPEPRTHFMEVKLNKIDYTLLTVSLIGLGVYVYYFLGGVFFA